MSKKTENLELHTWESSDYVLHEEFNENFETIDTTVQEVKDSVNDLQSDLGEIQGKLADSTNKIVTLKRGHNKVTTNQATNVTFDQIRGRTLINLLGREGNCEEESKFSVQIGQVASSFQSNKENDFNGKYGIKVYFDLADQYPASSYYGIPTQHIISGRNYLFASVIKDGSSSITGTVAVRKSGGYHKLSNKNNSASFILDYVTFTADGTENNVGIHFKIDSNNQWVAFDSLRLYEISDEEKTYIDSLTLEEATSYITVAYSYVDSVQSIQCPYIIRHGKNMIPPFHAWELSNDMMIHEDYSATLNATASSTFSYSPKIPIVPEENYTLSMDKVEGQLIYQLWDDQDDLVMESEVIGEVTFSPPPNAVSLSLKLGITSFETPEMYVFENPMLSIGSKVMKFEPKNDDLVFFNTSLCSSMDNEKADTITERENKLYKTTWFEKKELDGSMNWQLHEEGSGYKIVKLLNFAINKSIDMSNLVLISYNGQIVENEDFILENGSLHIKIMNSDSGWSDITPNPYDIKRYFNGWKYNDGELDQSVLNEDEKVDKGTAVLYKSFQYTPYTIVYQLQQSIEEEIEGQVGLSLFEGENQLTFGEGLIVKETVTPKYFNSKYWINGAFEDSEGLSYKTKKILDVYENGNEKASWSRVFHEDVDIKHYGDEQAIIETGNFNKNAQYSVTYFVADSLSTKVQHIDMLYDTNLNMVVRELVQDIADQKQQLAQVNHSLSEKYLRNEGNQYKEGKLYIRHEGDGLELFHHDTNGYAGIQLHSKGNENSDYGYIRYYDEAKNFAEGLYDLQEGLANGADVKEEGLLVIGSENDPHSVFGPDHLVLRSGARFIFDVNTMVYDSTDNILAEFRYNGDVKAYMDNNGEIIINDNKVLHEGNIRVSDDGKLQYKYNNEWYSMSGTKS
ncbi:hypothetical protein [Longirhabdus pacifica]|uniref:hypothetical protein n=1 Tax=Longirhabdus pacifica TaxID=2305227 RepID=UPI0010090609|nr:hypothetical protein [Longirhabdus pacifica]